VTDITPQQGTVDTPMPHRSGDTAISWPSPVKCTQNGAAPRSWVRLRIPYGSDKSAQIDIPPSPPIGCRYRTSRLQAAPTEFPMPVHQGPPRSSPGWSQRLLALVKHPSRPEPRPGSPPIATNWLPEGSCKADRPWENESPSR
jgi:hypothetical protein